MIFLCRLQAKCLHFAAADSIFPLIKSNPYCLFVGAQAKCLHFAADNCTAALRCLSGAEEERRLAFKCCRRLLELAADTSERIRKQSRLSNVRTKLGLQDLDLGEVARAVSG